MLVGIPSIISEFLYQHRSAAYQDKEFIQTHSSYIAGFRVKANVLNLMFYPVFMFRRLTFAATITILYEYPAVQLSLSSLGTACVFLCLRKH